LALRPCFPVEFRSPNSQRSIDSSDIYLHHLLYQVYLIDRSHSVLYLFFRITYCEKFLIPSNSQHDALKLHIRYCHFDCPCLASADRFRGRSHRHKVSRHINVSSLQPPKSLTFPWTNVLSTFDTHDTNVAILGICGGIAGSIQKCGGNPAQTTGQSNKSLFTLSATNAGSTINVSKGRWERCVKAAQLTCPKGSFESTCIGGATPSGDVKFSLTAA
jgi:hypothetical protein